MFTKRETVLISLLICLFLFSGGLILQHYRRQQDVILTAEKTVEDKNNPKKETKKRIVVHIAGQVQKPGVYSLEEGQRVVDLLQLAGGGTIGADLDQLNLASLLIDGQKVLVPPKEISSSALTSNPKQSISSHEEGININTAGESELDALPGIGPALAKRIIRYREEKGNFGSVEDLRQVPGIGDKKFADLKDLVTVY